MAKILESDIYEGETFTEHVVGCASLFRIRQIHTICRFWGKMAHEISFRHLEFISLAMATERVNGIVMKNLVESMTGNPSQEPRRLFKEASPISEYNWRIE